MNSGSLETGPEIVRAGDDRLAPSRLPLPVGELVFAALMLGLGLFALFGAFGIRVPVGAQVGPTVFPIMVAVILLVSSAAVIIGVFRGDRAEPEDGEDIDASVPTDWVTLLKLVALVVAHLLLINVIGWAPAAALLFGGAAWSLGAKRWWMAFLIGFVVAIVVQIVFGGLLGLSLPWGPLFGWLGGMF